MTKNKRITYTVAMVAFLAIVAAGLYYVNAKNTFEKDKSSGTVPVSESGSRPGETSGSNTTTGGTSSSSTDTKIEKGGVTIGEPKAGASVEPATTVVSGTVTTSVGGDLYYMVKGANSGVLVDTKVQSLPAGSVDAPYSFTLSFDNLPKGSDQAVLEVYLMNGTERLGYADVGVKI